MENFEKQVNKEKVIYENKKSLEDIMRKNMLDYALKLTMAVNRTKDEYYTIPSAHEIS